MESDVKFKLALPVTDTTEEGKYIYIYICLFVIGNVSYN